MNEEDRRQAQEPNQESEGDELRAEIDGSESNETMRLPLRRGTEEAHSGTEMEIDSRNVAESVPVEPLAGAVGAGDPSSANEADLLNSLSSPITATENNEKLAIDAVAARTNLDNDTTSMHISPENSSDLNGECLISSLESINREILSSSDSVPVGNNTSAVATDLRTTPGSLGEIEESPSVSSPAANAASEQEVENSMANATVQASGGDVNHPLPPSQPIDREHRGISSYCNICLQEYQVGDIVVWSRRPDGCHHAFHEDCLLDWLSRKPSCPNCRQVFFSIEDSPEPVSSVGENSHHEEDAPSAPAIVPLWRAGPDTLLP